MVESLLFINHTHHGLKVAYWVDFSPRKVTSATVGEQRGGCCRLLRGRIGQVPWWRWWQLDGDGCWLFYRRGKWSEESMGWSTSCVKSLKMNSTGKVRKHLDLYIGINIDSNRDWPCLNETKCKQLVKSIFKPESFCKWERLLPSSMFGERLGSGIFWWGNFLGGYTWTDVSVTSRMRI